MARRSSINLVLSLVAMAALAVFSIGAGYPEASADARALASSPASAPDDDPLPLACNVEDCDEHCADIGCEIGDCDPVHGICKCFLCD